MVLAADPPLPSVQEVMGHLDDLYRAASSHAKLKMKVVTEFYDRELEMESWSVGKDHALIVVRAPAREAGTATLRSPEGLWSYAARADRLVRIPSGMLSEAWMGSHLSNEDLVREMDYVKDFDSTLAWKEEGGRRLLEIVMRPKPDTPVVYTKTRYLVDPEGWVPVRSEDFDGEKIARTTAFGDVKTVGKHKLPMTLSVVPGDKPREATRLEYLGLELDVPVDASLFTARGLRRAAGRQ